MTREPVVSIRWKMMIMMVTSGAFAVATTGVLLAMAQFLSRTPVASDILLYLGRSGYAIPIILLTALVLFIGFFAIVSAGTLRYMSRISQAVNQIAAGDLDTFIPVQSRDELGRLAGDINQMAIRLKRSIEEERESERAKYDLITSVSHDLRTPLTSILGYLDLVDGAMGRDSGTGDASSTGPLPADDQSKLRRYVSTAHGKARDLKVLIDDLFELTRVNYGGLALRTETVNLGRLLEQLAEEFVPILERAGMEYRLNLPAERVAVQADPALLVRVFENLMSNAVRYGPDGRFIDIEMAAIVATAPGAAAARGVTPDAAGAASPRAIVRVANYGAPIPEAQLGRIFERFVRVEGSRSRDTGGAGLGLAIAKSIVDLHGGSIRAYNDAGRTVFEVSLP